jgi:plastocyanin
MRTSQRRGRVSRVDQPMTWVGNFTTHPIKGSGGSTPNPFDAAKDNLSNPGTEQESGAVVFTTPGTYGYICEVHPSMTGAVLVVPAP